MLLSLLLPLGLNLLQLDDRGALELLGNDLSYLVMISFSSCEPCKFLTPHLIRLQANLNADGIPLMIATMDSETQPALGERHGIKDYPSLLLFVRGESVDNPHLFPGSTLQELVAWLREAGALATSRDALRAEVDARGEELPTGVVHPGQRMPELAELAMRPPPADIVAKLLKQGLVTAEQAALAPTVTMCDDVAVESDSGGHTDNRHMPVLLPVILARRDQIAKETGMRIRVGGGGGIGCPEAAAAAFAMGADFILTGTINQLSRQAGTCDQVRQALSEATYSDVTMAPAAVSLRKSRHSLLVEK